MPLSLYLSVYFKSTDRYNDNKEGGRANLVTVWAWSPYAASSDGDQAQTGRAMQASRCQKVREPSTAGLILDAFGLNPLGRSKALKGGTPEKRH